MGIYLIRRFILRALLEARTDTDGDSSKMAREGVEGSAGDASVDAMLATDYASGCAADGSPLPVAEMLRLLWRLLWPDAAWGGVRGEKWSELGFQRGGPASDLRGSGRLGLHTLLHFVLKHRGTFDAMIASQKRVEDEGKVLSYPVSIACINVTAVLVEVCCDFFFCCLNPRCPCLLQLARSRSLPSCAAVCSLLSFLHRSLWVLVMRVRAAEGRQRPQCRASLRLPCTWRSNPGAILPLMRLRTSSSRRSLRSFSPS